VTAEQAPFTWSAPLASGRDDARKAESVISTDLPGGDDRVRLPKSDTPLPETDISLTSSLAENLGQAADLQERGVSDGIRTHDIQDHNLAL
jgi:hypothetical protein